MLFRSPISGGEDYQYLLTLKLLENDNYNVVLSCYKPNTQPIIKSLLFRKDQLEDANEMLSEIVGTLRSKHIDVLDFKGKEKMSADKFEDLLTKWILETKN